jgi:type IV fimbrial biogenesis protein FimT
MDREIRHTRRPRAAGLTLIELLSTIAAATVVLAVGVPSYQAMVDGQRIHARVNTLVAHLQLARSEAVKRGQRVVLCPGNQSAGCADGHDWSGGWLVFADANRDRDYQDGEALLQLGDGSAPLQLLSSPGRRRVVYQPDGSVLGGSNTTFRLCSAADAGRNRAVIISMTGRPRVSRRDASNRLVSCG